MHLIGALLGWILLVFILLLIARMIIDWLQVADYRAPWVYKARSFTHAATEPVIAPVRRVLKPVRIGGFSLDLAYTVVFIVALVLRAVVTSL